MLASIIEILTGGITNVASGIGQGLSTLAQSVFMKYTPGTSGAAGTYSTTELSTFGTLVVAFAGIGLAIGLCRWIVGFITSLGARNK